MEYKKNFLLRFLRLFLGLALCALSVVVAVHAHVGLSPWDVFHQGVSNVTGITMGQASIITGIVILAGGYFLGEPVGIGTICNILGVGTMIDLFNAWHLIPDASGFGVGILMMLASLEILAMGSYFYIGAGFGSGPRDSLMVALVKRFYRIPVGVIRAAIEGAAMFFGWLMGGSVGIGSAIAIVGIGFAIQYTFKVLRFNVGAIKHESAAQTLRNLGLLGKK